MNLDAMIPREDMVSVGAEGRAPRLEKIDITHLDQAFFVSMLRKPDFQRETANWSPDKVADLIDAFVDGDLIPAVILWQKGANVFVIDGAHRLSALIAWVNDDYGDSRASLEYFGGHIPEEQRRIADRTRKLVNSTVGPYAQLAAARKQPHNVSQEMQIKLGNLAVNAIVAQWVPQLDGKAAEDSFFKINQAATQIDPTEKQILRSRKAPNSIAARAIVGGGRGHKYWSAFEKDTQKEIEELAKDIYSLLYEPYLGMPIKTLDVPVAGKGYSTLPFIYELVNWANRVPDLVKSSKFKLATDEDGTKTIQYLKVVRSTIHLVTGTDPSSLGLHPLVYFYTRGGEFQPIAFIATSALLKELSEKNQLKKFIKARPSLEEFLLNHKEFITLIVKRTGGGLKSLGRTLRYLACLVEKCAAGEDEAGIISALKNDKEFAFLIASMDAPNIRDGDNPTRRFNRSTKTASFVNTAIQGAVKCTICGGLVHKNSMHFDHLDKASDGGGSEVGNARVTHPYCNSSRG